MKAVYACALTMGNIIPGKEPALNFKNEKWGIYTNFIETIFKRFSPLNFLDTFLMLYGFPYNVKYQYFLLSGSWTTFKSNRMPTYSSVLTYSETKFSRNFRSILRFRRIVFIFSTNFTILQE